MNINDRCIVSPDSPINKNRVGYFQFTEGRFTALTEKPDTEEDPATRWFTVDSQFVNLDTNKEEVP